MLPNFDTDGHLPIGVWDCTGSEFLERFLFSAEREAFHGTIVNVIDYATHNGASRILVGGSFITNKTIPSDFDCVIVFPSEALIPTRRDSIVIEGKAVDIFFASEDQPQVVASFRKLFAISRFKEVLGVVNIMIRRKEKVLWDILREPDEGTFEIIRRMYINRHFVDKDRHGKVLVTVHGIRSHGEWNAEVTLIASGNGWMVAPFTYGYVYPNVFLDNDYRRKLVDRFREHLFTIQQMFEMRSVSIIAHSFGTYLVARYLLGFDAPPTSVDTLILTGAILDHNLDLSCFDKKVACIVNEVAPNDQWVKWARIANLGSDPLFGLAGTKGFAKPTSRLIQRQSDIFTHINVIRRDVVAQRWMPILEAHVGAHERELYIDLIESSRQR